MEYKNVINWLKNNGYDMTDDRYELAADNLNDHTMLDLVELLDDYGKFVLSSVSITEGKCEDYIPHWVTDNDGVIHECCVCGKDKSEH